MRPLLAANRVSFSVSSDVNPNRNNYARAIANSPLTIRSSNRNIETAGISWMRALCAITHTTVFSRKKSHTKKVQIADVLPVTQFSSILFVFGTIRSHNLHIPHIPHTLAHTNTHTQGERAPRFLTIDLELSNGDLRERKIQRLNGEYFSCHFNNFFPSIEILTHSLCTYVEWAMCMPLVVFAEHDVICYCRKRMSQGDSCDNLWNKRTAIWEKRSISKAIQHWTMNETKFIPFSAIRMLDALRTMNSVMCFLSNALSASVGVGGRHERHD